MITPAAAPNAASATALPILIRTLAQDSVEFRGCGICHALGTIGRRELDRLDVLQNILSCDAAFRSAVNFGRVYQSPTVVSSIFSHFTSKCIHLR